MAHRQSGPNSFRKERRLLRIFLLIIKLAIGLASLVAAALVRMPFTLAWRPWLLAAVVTVSAGLLAASLGWRRGTGQSLTGQGLSGQGWTRRADLAPFVLAAAAPLLALGCEGRFQFDRWTVNHADPAQIEALGRHVIVGYTDPAFVRDLIARRAIAGLFLTRRNVAGRDTAAVAREIAELQAVRASQGLQPLLVATDQEGGSVSRLSPLVPREPPLAQIVRDKEERGAREAAVTAYAREQGRALAALGVNLNFAPVVDLDFGLRNPNDAYTRISRRAISSDPAIVAEVATWYCDGLAAEGVRCTAKHFPGLGRVFEDTHRDEGRLDAPLDELAQADWRPFRALLDHGVEVLMVGHVRSAALDPAGPVSTSRAAIEGLLRKQWGYDGLIVTDDMTMGAIYFGNDGSPQAAIRALNAGVDLLLFSFDGEQVYPALAALLRAHDTLDSAMLAKSTDRLRRLTAEPIKRAPLG